MDPFSIAAIGSGLGSLFGGLFGGGDEDEHNRQEIERYNARMRAIERNRTEALNAARESQARTQGYLSEIPGIISPHYKPFEEAGFRSIPTLEQQYGALINNPEMLLNQIGGGHRASPGYKFKTEEAIKAANQAAAAGGMLGSPSHQQSLAKTVTGLADQDYYNYLQNALGLFGAGLGGFGNLNQIGYNAASSLGEDLGNVQMNKANLAHAGGLTEAMINRNANEDYSYATENEDMRNRRMNERSDLRNRGMLGNLGNMLGHLGGYYMSRPSSGSGYENNGSYWTSQPYNFQQGYMNNNSGYGVSGNSLDQLQNSFRW